MKITYFEIGTPLCKEGSFFVYLFFLIASTLLVYFLFIFVIRNS